MAKNKTLLSLKNDLVFKRIFGDTNNIEILVDFLKSILDIPEEEYDHIEIVDSQFRIDRGNDKASILDIKIHTKTKNVINVEMQIIKYKSMARRLMYYSSKLIAEQMSSGDKYNKIKKVINITILDHSIFNQNKAYHHKFMLFDNKNQVLLDDGLEIHTLELKKLPPVSDNSKLFDWLIFIDTDNEEVLEMLSEKNPAIKKAQVTLKHLSQDEETRLLADAREKQLMDEASRLEEAIEEGIERGKIEGIAKGIKEGKIEGIREGTQKGIEKGKLEAAKNLLSLGIDKETILKATNITEQQFSDLQK